MSEFNDWAEERARVARRRQQAADRPPLSDLVQHGVTWGFVIAGGLSFALWVLLVFGAGAIFG